MSTANQIAWKRVANISPSIQIETGGPEYGGRAVAHIPDTENYPEQLLVEDFNGKGIYRRVRLVCATKNKIRWSDVQYIPVSLRFFLTYMCGFGTLMVERDDAKEIHDIPNVDRRHEVCS